MVKPLLVVEENCQLRTSATWSHVATGGLVKKFTFCAEATWCCNSSKKIEDATLARVSIPFHQRVLSYLWVVGEHVVPQDGGPGVGHLADIGDDHHGQGMSLENRC